MPHTSQLTPLSNADALEAPAVSVIPVPRLHAALYDAALCASCEDCGDYDPWHPWSTANTGIAAPGLTPSPLSNAEVRATLSALRGMTADEMTQSLNMAAAEYLQPISRSESAALDAFAGKIPQKTAPHTDPRLVQQQLLMVWVQEERVLDILELARRSVASERRLQALLGDEDLAELLQEPLEGLEAVDELSEDVDACAAESEKADTALELESMRGLLPSWKFVFSRLARLLPENSVLAVNDADMADAVLTCGTPENLDEQMAATETLNAARAVRVLASRLVPGLPDISFLCLVPEEYTEYTTEG